MSKRIIDTLKHDKPWTKARGLQEVLRKAQVFTIDNAVDYFATESIPDTTITEDVTDIWKMSDYPNCAPPFDVFWMETSLPRAYKEYIENNGGTPPQQWGALFMARDFTKMSLTAVQEFYANECARNIAPEIFAEAKWALQYMPVVQHGSGAQSVEFTGTVTTVLVRDDGSVVTRKYREGTPQYAGALQRNDCIEKDATGSYVEFDCTTTILDPQHRNAEAVKRLTHMVSTLYAPFWFAISLMHCKNVTSTLVDPCHPNGKKKQSMPCLREHYRTLHIHPMREVLKREGHQETLGLKQALHICRGHFRDYSRGTGLFGKHKGVYWVDQHVRGSSTYGKVVKAYAIHPT